MKNSIRNIFGLKKKSDKKDINGLDHVHLPTSSVSSFSSDISSNDSQPRTPTGTEIQESRGIFRTLEPVWYFQSSLLPQQQQHEWLRFDDASQYALESSLNVGRPDCVLSQTPLGPCKIMFRPMPPAKVARHSMMVIPSSTRAQNASMPSLRPHTIQTLELNKNIRRTISPVWWFEQDSVDGSKGMCRFDYKNQVRLEALSEGRTRLVLTDDAFHVPFTVVLEPPKQRDLKEEVRGFLYLEPVSTAFQLAYEQQNKLNEYISYEGEDEWSTGLVRRNSI
jgi:hypothetical protein